MAGFVEDTGRSHGIAEPLQMTVAVSDGERLYAARYASGPFVNSLFVSEDARSVRALYPDDERFSIFSDESRVIVSEPLGDLPGVWREVPAGTALIVQPGEDLEVPSGPRCVLEEGLRDQPDCADQRPVAIEQLQVAGPAARLLTVPPNVPDARTAPMRPSIS